MLAQPLSAQLQRLGWRYGLLGCILVALLGPAIATPASASTHAAHPSDTHTLYLPHLALYSHPIAPGLPIDPYATHTGEGTYYAADGTGNCSFDASPGDLMVAALNDPDYHSALYCGAYVSVTGPNGSVVVRIVDRCPECAAGDLDLSPQAFEQIAPLIAGRVPISWHVIDSGITSPISVMFKDGSNQWWTGMQIRNHRTPIFRLEFLNSSGSFQAINREQYNYFVQTNMGPGPYTLRITDFYGRSIVQGGVPLLNNAAYPGSVQFPAAP